MQPPRYFRSSRRIGPEGRSAAGNDRDDALLFSVKIATIFSEGVHGMKKIIIAADHGALELKKNIVSHLEHKGYSVDDLGVFNEDSVDYPDMARVGCEAFLKGDYEYGILACGTGIGISISANKINGIRCALPQNVFAARMAREHNNANILAFGGRIDYPEPVEDMIDAFDESVFSSEERHGRRVAKMNSMDNT